MNICDHVISRRAKEEKGSEMSKKSAGAKRANYCFSLLNMQFCDEGVVFVAVVVVEVMFASARFPISRPCR